MAHDEKLAALLKQAGEAVENILGDAPVAFTLMLFPGEGPQAGQMLTATTIPYDQLVPVLRMYIDEPNLVDEDGVVLHDVTPPSNSYLN